MSTQIDEKNGNETTLNIFPQLVFRSKVVRSTFQFNNWATNARSICRVKYLMDDKKRVGQTRFSLPLNSSKSDSKLIGRRINWTNCTALNNGQNYGIIVTDDGKLIRVAHILRWKIKIIKITISWAKKVFGNHIRMIDFKPVSKKISTQWTPAGNHLNQ